ncbi:MAG TPA: hypothetical protein VJ717_05910 [Gemmatimonadaceae bacterium]|nr:hypothetical protein [Gemmatimonadaceae bacterium]
MKLFYQLSLVALAGALVTVPATAGAQRKNDDKGPRSEVARDGRWDDNDWNRRNGRDGLPGRRVGQNDEWYRKHRARLEAHCRRKPNDRQCDELYRRNDGYRRGTDGNWCLDNNRDGRCDYVANRRDSRSGVIRRDGTRDRGPEWERWIRENGRDLVPIITPR